MPQTPLRIVQLSDVHLVSGDARSQKSVDALAAVIAGLKPQRIILTGDLTDNGCCQAADLAWSKSLLPRLPAPVSILPGNHDVGDKRGHGEAPVSAQRLANWRSVFGEDRFSLDAGPWRLLGFDSLIAGSGLPDDDAQLHWMDDQLAQAKAAGQRVAAFTHEPPFLGAPGRTYGDKSDYWPLHVDAEEAYLTRLTHPSVHLVASGHVHWKNIFEFRGARHVWCPSPTFIVDDAKFPRGGGVQGFMAYEFGDGEPTVNFIPVEGPERWIYFNQPRVEVPGREPIVLAELTLDFTGTLSKDGKMLPGVADRLRSISASTRITVLTADTFGTAQRELAGLPVEVVIVQTGEDKATAVRQRGPEKTLHIGNGNNDVAACKAAALSIAVVGPEGAAGELVRAAAVVVSDIRDALDLVSNPVRLKATLRA